MHQPISASILLCGTALLCACTSSPSVTLTNNAGRPVSGYIQFPTEGGFLYPAPSTREMFKLAAGQTLTFESPSATDASVENWSDRAAVVLGRPNDDLYVSTVKARNLPGVAAEIVTDGDDNLCVRWTTELKSPPEERVVPRDKLKEVIGKTGRDLDDDRKAYRERERAKKRLQDSATDDATTR